MVAWCYPKQCIMWCDWWSPSELSPSVSGLPSVSLVPRPHPKLGKGPGVTCKDVLYQQSSFGVEELRSSIANYNIHLHVTNITSLWCRNVIVICWLGTYGNTCKWHQAPFPIFWVGPGDEASTSLQEAGIWKSRKQKWNGNWKWKLETEMGTKNTPITGVMFSS